MAQTLLTIADVTREALSVLHEELTISKKAVRRYEDRFGKPEQIGNSVKIRKSAKYAVGNSPVVSGAADGNVEDYVTLTCDQRRNVVINFTSNELSMSVNDIRNFLRPAMSRLVREIDAVGFAMVKTAPQVRIGRTVTGALTYLDYTKMNAAMETQLMSGGRTLYASAFDHAVVADANKGLFNSQKEIEDQYRKGLIGVAGGFEWVATENAPTIAWASVAPAAGTLSAAITEGATVLAVTGMGANAVVKAGTAYTVAGCYAIDPETQDQLNYLYTFIAASDVTLNASGAGNITIAAPVYTSATNRTQANIWAGAGGIVLTGTSGAAITPLEAGTVASKAGKLVLGVDDGAIALGCIDLHVDPEENMSRESLEGISIRMWKSADAINDIFRIRCDIHFGWAVLRPEGLASTMGLVA